MNQEIMIVKLPSALDQFHLSKSTWYKQRKLGLVPPEISLGERSVGYLQHELYAVLSARIAGKSIEQIKELVRSLVVQRKGLFDEKY